LRAPRPSPCSRACSCWAPLPSVSRTSRGFAVRSVSGDLSIYSLPSVVFVPPRLRLWCSWGGGEKSSRASREKEGEPRRLAAGRMITTMLTRSLKGFPGTGGPRPLRWRPAGRTALCRCACCLSVHPGRASVCCRPADNTADLASLVPGCFLSANVQFSTNFYNHGDPTFDVRSEEMKKVTVCTHTSLRFGPRQERPLPCRHGRMLRRAGAPVPKTDRFARALTCASCLPRAVPAHGRALVDARLPRPQRSDSPAFLRL